MVRFAEEYKLSDVEFEALWKELANALIGLGETSTDIDELKKEAMKLGQGEADNDLHDVLTNAERFIKEKKYDKAIDIYNEALKSTSLSLKDQALIFTKRSVSHLMIENIDSWNKAKKDADLAIHLWPSWWNGYYRLACVLIKLDDLEAAERMLEYSLALNPESEEAQNKLAITRKTIGEFILEEHLDPIYHPMTSKEIIAENCAKYGLSEKDFLHLVKLNYDVPVVGDVIKGHQYRDGIGVKRDYKKSAIFYSKAAENGNPEAMFNLGRLYYFGHGVLQNFKTAVFWLEKSACLKPEKMKDSGVPESQHMLGYMYYEGIGVEQDYHEAAKWFEKAVANGYTVSSNNLGVLYYNGKGVNKDLQKAIHFFNVSAKGGSTQGMRNLANCLFRAKGKFTLSPTDADVSKAMIWLKIAANKGDLIAAREYNRRKESLKSDFIREIIVELLLKETIEKNNRYFAEQFRGKVTVAAENGSLTAKQHLEIWTYLAETWKAFKEEDNFLLVSSLSKPIHLDHEIIEIPELFYSVIKDRYKTHPDELETVVCYAKIFSGNKSVLDIFEKYPKYKQDECLNEMFIASLTLSGKIQDALKVAKKALKKWPNSPKILYSYAVVHCIQDNPYCIKTFDKFLAVAPNDHRNIPSCYYRKAQFYIHKNDYKNFIETFEEGLSAEENQLPLALNNITLKDMNTRKSMLYEGFVIEGRIIDWSYLTKSNVIVILFKDGNGDIGGLEIRNWLLKNNPFIDALKSFRPGYWISVINPFVTSTKESKLMIHVEKISDVKLGDLTTCFLSVNFRLFIDIGEKVCSYCGKETKSEVLCSKCSMACYCSSKCLNSDLIDHEEICKILKNYQRY
uniref:MYND-type domain-containing protein n=1 Tax=Panagrolaimus davidi TaxID=227884 RepID=A0A914PSV5_9BILA